MECEPKEEETVPYSEEKQYPTQHGGSSYTPQHEQFQKTVKRPKGKQSTTQGPYKAKPIYPSIDLGSDSASPFHEET